MGKSSSSSCLKMLGCGGNTAAADDDDDQFDLRTTQTKASGNKRGWSFRKKGGRHRGLGKDVTLDATTFSDKEVPLVVKANFAPVKSTSVDEKPRPPAPVDKVGEVSALEYDGKPKPSLEVIASANDCSVACEKPKVRELLVALDNDINSASGEANNTVVVLEDDSFEPSADLGIVTESGVPNSENNKMAEPETLNSKAASEYGNETSVKMDEDVSAVVQASIRGFLAQQEFLQLKNVVMLQAVIRGYLVRRNAVETLHCIRSIAKVQALVRAQSSKTLDQNYNKSEGQFSTAKLLKNSFARQLLESTPKPTSVNIRCDPLSPNSAWGWLERWMSLTTEVLQKAESSEELHESNQVQPYHSQADVELSSMPLSDSFVSEVIMDETAKSSETKDNNVVDPVDPESSLRIFVEKQQSHHQMAEEINNDTNSIKIDAPVGVTSVELVSLPDKAAEEIQHPKHSVKRLASEELTGEGKKLSCGSREVTDADIIVTRSNFEEHTSAANPSNSLSLSHENVGAENPTGTSSSLEETLSKSSKPQNLVAGSECGTELSVTSTLDSPDRCEPEIAQPEPLEVTILEKSAGVDKSNEGQNCETDGTISNICDLPSETTPLEEVHETSIGVSVSPDVAEVTNDQVEHKFEMKASDDPMDFVCVSSGADGNSAVLERKEDIHDEHLIGLQAEKLSPETSPRGRLMILPESQGTPSDCHITVSESQGTPSSRVLVSGKRNKIGKKSSRSAGKRSPSTPNLESGRSSVEHLTREHKSGKRRTSFGSTKSDADREPKESNSQTSLPSYMQATKSAKAKAHSPKSSPDFEATSKKRQSLPAAGGRQGSPRVSRSSSEAAQSAKANGSHPSTERKWQR